MKKTLSFILAVILLFALAACGSGGNSTDPNIGKYIGYQIDVFGWEPIESVYDAGENYVELKSGGKGTFCLDGEDVAIKWTLDGENLTMTASGQTCTGTLKDGLITTDYFGMDMTMTFLKEGTSTPTASAAAEVGFWEMYEEDENGNPLTTEEKREIGIDYTIQFNADGTGTTVFDHETAFLWGNSKITISDGEGGTVDFPYTVSGDELTLDTGDSILIFRRADTVSRPVESLSSYADYWAGDWYGWWYVTDAGGEWANFEGYCTDACAMLEVYDDDTGYFAAWNETNIAGEAFCTCDVSFSDGVTDAGCMVSENGSFFTAGGIGHADWVIDPGASVVSEFDHMIMIQAAAIDSSNSDNYIYADIFLRPWGMTWDDVAIADTTDMPYDDMMPLRYDDWYLPMLEAGVTEAPSSFDEPVPDGHASGATATADGTYDYESEGEILFRYPTDQFDYDDYWGSLVGKSGSPTIRFNADWQENQRQESLDSIDTYATEEGFSRSEFMVAGSNAYRYTYIDGFGDYCVNTYISFSTPTDNYCGVWVNVSSSVSFDDCQSDIVEAIIQSLSLK